MYKCENIVITKSEILKLNRPKKLHMPWGELNTLLDIFKRVFKAPLLFPHVNDP